LIKRSYANGLVECYAPAGSSTSEADVIDLRALSALQFGLFIPLQIAAEWPLWAIDTAFAYLAAEVDAAKALEFTSRYQRFMITWVYPPLPPSKPESKELDFKLIAKNLRWYVQGHIDLWRVALAVVRKSSEYRSWFELGLALGDEVSRPVVGFREPIFPMALFPYYFGPRDLGWRPLGFAEITDAQFKAAVCACYSRPNEFPQTSEQVVVPYARYRLLHDVSEAGFSSVADSFFVEEILPPNADIEALRATPCRAAPVDGASVFIPDPVQEAILKALDGRALRKEALAKALRIDDSRNLYKRGKARKGPLSELMVLGKVENDRRLGYYRPDALPPQLR
jgi:hypothetical protein